MSRRQRDARRRQLTRFRIRRSCTVPLYVDHSQGPSSPPLRESTPVKRHRSQGSNASSCSIRTTGVLLDRGGAVGRASRGTRASGDRDRGGTPSRPASNRSPTARRFPFKERVRRLAKRPEPARRIKDILQLDIEGDMKGHAHGHRSLRPKPQHRLAGVSAPEECGRPLGHLQRQGQADDVAVESDRSL